MAYITEADLRASTAAEFARGLTLTTDEAPPATLAAAITRASGRVDSLTDDHFESQSLTLDLMGDGSSMLTLPKRCTAVTTVKTRDLFGTLTTQATTVWRLVSSLNATGSEMVSPAAEDYIQIIPGQYLTLTGWGQWWPSDPKAVQVVGTFGWTVTPPEIKRAVALLVWQHFKTQGDVLRRSTAIETADARYTLTDLPPEAQEIINRYVRTANGSLVG